MPDENCRRCGFILKPFLKCQNCRILFQYVCEHCEQKTLPRFHICNQNTINL